MTNYRMAFAAFLFTGMVIIISLKLGNDTDAKTPITNTKFQLESVKSDAYIRGFIDGASYQEVYRYYHSNDGPNPTIILEDLIREEKISYQRSYDTNYQNRVTGTQETVNVGL